MLGKIKGIGSKAIFQWIIAFEEEKKVIGYLVLEMYVNFMHLWTTRVKLVQKFYCYLHHFYLR